MNGTIFLLLIVLAMLALYVAWVLEYDATELRHDAAELWHRWPDVKPRAYLDIRNYPIAVYDPEIGLIIEFAEYHHHESNPWRLVGDGYPVHPFAWFELPEVSHDAIPSAVSADER